MTKSLKAREFLHSCKLRTKDGVAVVISELLHFDDGSKEPHLRYLDNPNRPFYITKPGFRDHSDKKEFEDINKLDKYTAPDGDMWKHIYKILNDKRTLPRQVDVGALRENPYVYLADQDVQVFIKHAYRKAFEASGVVSSPPSVGFFDIERTIDTGELCVISVTHENKIYTGIYNKFCHKPDGSKIDLEQITQMYEQYVVPVIEKEVESHPTIKAAGRFPIIPHFKFFDSELDMLRWVLSKYHESKTSFIGVWNIDFDIPRILQLLEKEGVAPEDLFVHPDVPAKYRKVHYAFDKQTAEKPNAHIADYWHWFYTPGYTQFLDSMALFAKIRKGGQKEVSYSLDAILKKNGFGGKLKFDHLKHLDDVSREDWHRLMVKDHFAEYILYNMIDVIALQLMEWYLNDIGSMTVLSDNTPIDKYSKETRKLVTDYATRWIDKGYALGVSKPDMTQPWDRYYPAIGGAVLSPNRITDIGIRPFTDYPSDVTRVHAFVNDVDFSSIYPSVTNVFNISKDTKLYTVVGIKGDQVTRKGYEAVEVFFASIRNQREECMRIAKDYYDLPGFEEMEMLFNKELNTLAA